MRGGGGRGGHMGGFGHRPIYRGHTHMHRRPILRGFGRWRFMWFPWFALGFGGLLFMLLMIR